MSKVEHFWTPPRPGERILGMCTWQDAVVVCTTDGVYAIAGSTRHFMDNEVQMLSREVPREIGKHLSRDT